MCSVCTVLRCWLYIILLHLVSWVGKAACVPQTSCLPARLLSSALLLCITVWNLSLLTCETPLGVFGQAALLAVYFLSIIIRNVFIVASFLKDSLAGYRIVGFLLVLWMSLSCFLHSMVSDEKPAIQHIVVSLNTLAYFPSSFKIFSGLSFQKF